MQTDLPQDISDFAAVATKRLTRLGGPPAALRAETDDELRISLDLPGVDGKSIDVTADGDVLTIRATRSDEKRDDRENFHIVERHFGTYQRSIQLPFRVDPRAIQARVENGVLKVVVPKSQGADRPQKVPVQSQTGSADTQPSSDGKSAASG